MSAFKNVELTNAIAEIEGEPQYVLEAVDYGSVQGRRFVSAEETTPQEADIERAIERVGQQADWISDGIAPHPYPFTQAGYDVFAADLRLILTELAGVRGRAGSARADLGGDGLVAATETQRKSEGGGA